MFKKFLGNQKGGAMLMAIMAMAIISMFTVTAIVIGSSNAKQAQTEGKRTQAYYVADTGAKTLIEQLTDKEKYKPDKVEEKLKEMIDMGDINGKYRDKEFVLKVTKVEKEEHKYEIKSTAEIDGTRDGTTAIITIGETGTTGYEIGAGKIFIDGNDSLDIAYLPQLSGEGLSIYTKAKLKNDLTQRPIRFTQGDFAKLFRSRNDRGNKTDEELSKQYEMATTENGKKLGNYHLKIKETDGKYIKKEVIERKESEKTKNDSTIELNYEMQKSEVVKYFSYGKLPDDKIKGKDLEDAISNLFLLPIDTVEEYNKYINNNDIFPVVSHYNPKGPNVDKETFKDIKYNQFNKTETVTLKEGVDALIEKRLVIKENGDLTIITSGDTNIVLDKGLEMSKGGNLNIVADGKVNVYIKGHAQPDGDITVTKPGGGNTQANFYIDSGTKFQTNNASKVIGVNLYAPQIDVQLQNEVEWEGVIIAKKLQFKDNAIFRAPSGGTASDSSMNKKPGGIESVTWTEWQSDK